MADIAASVLTRLKNKAQASGRSYQLCLQLFCQEEFLRRLEKSKYAENFVLKGGLFIYSLTEFEAELQSMLIFYFDKCQTRQSNCELCLKKLSQHLLKMNLLHLR